MTDLDRLIEVLRVLPPDALKNWSVQTIGESISVQANLNCDELSPVQIFTITKIMECKGDMIHD